MNRKPHLSLLRRSVLRLLSLENRFVPSTVQGTVFEDANGNQLLDSGETGVAGWTVFVDNNRNHNFDAGEVSVVTDSAGHYFFDTTSVTPNSNGYNYFDIDLQFGSGGRWLRSMPTSVYVHPINEPAAERNLGVHFEPYTHIEPDGPETRVNVATTGTQDAVTVASDAAGNYAMTWRNLPASGNPSVMLRVFNADGSPQTGDITVAAAPGIIMPTIDMADNGRLVVAWTGRSTSNILSAYARVYTLNGTAATSIITVAAGKQNRNVLVYGVGMDAHGDFAILYSQIQPQIQMVVQRYTAAGATNGKAIVLDQPQTMNGRRFILMDAAGNFTVVWEYLDLMAQRFGANGKSIGSTFIVSAGLHQGSVGSSRVDLQACKLEYSIVSPK